MRNIEEPIIIIDNSVKVSEGISRREFLKATSFLVGGLAIGSTTFLAGCGFPAAPKIDVNAYSIEEDKVIVNLDRVPELSKVGGSASIMHDDERISVIVARFADSDYVVASNQCTHRERPMGYDNENRQLVCSSGKSKFMLDGSIVRGPAEQPLRIYRWSLNQDNLIIDLLDES